MTYDEALSAAIDGERVRCASMPPGCYVEHSFKRGYLRCWPVDRPEDEPERTQCDWVAHGSEPDEEWSIVEAPKFDSWGKPLQPSRGLNAIEVDRDIEELATMPQSDFDAAMSVWKRRNPEPQLAPKIAPVGWGNPLPPVDPPAPAPARDAWGRPIG